jgi:ABC-type proline/glycine betaine transport system permease subunit
MRDPYLVAAGFGVASIVMSALGHPYVGMFLAAATSIVFIAIVCQRNADRRDARRRNPRK